MTAIVHTKKMGAAWIPRTPEEAHKRAAGRRKYHAARRKVQRERRAAILAVLIEKQWQSYGLGRQLAARFKVHAAQICRDIAYWHSQRQKLIDQSGLEIATGVMALMAKAASQPSASDITTQPVAPLPVADCVAEKKEPALHSVEWVRWKFGLPPTIEAPSIRSTQPETLTNAEPFPQQVTEKPDLDWWRKR